MAKTGGPHSPLSRLLHDRLDQFPGEIAEPPRLHLVLQERVDIDDKAAGADQQRESPVSGAARLVMTSVTSRVKKLSGSNRSCSARTRQPPASAGGSRSADTGKNAPVLNTRKSRRLLKPANGKRTGGWINRPPSAGVLISTAINWRWFSRAFGRWESVVRLRREEVPLACRQRRGSRYRRDRPSAGEGVAGASGRPTPLPNRG